MTQDGPSVTAPPYQDILAYQNATPLKIPVEQVSDSSIVTHVLHDARARYRTQFPPRPAMNNNARRDMIFRLWGQQPPFEPPYLNAGGTALSAGKDTLTYWYGRQSRLKPAVDVLNYVSAAEYQQHILDTVRQASVEDGAYLLQPHWQRNATTLRTQSSKPAVQQWTLSDQKMQCGTVFSAWARMLGPVYVVDISQAELYVMAALSDDSQLAHDLTHHDFHSLTAQTVYNCTRPEAKIINFAMRYGSTATRIANILDWAPERAQEVITAFAARYATADAWSQAQIALAEEQGYVVRLDGTQVQVSNANTQTISYICQSAVALLMEDAISRTWHSIRSDYLYQIHDSVILRSREAADVFVSAFDTPLTELDNIEWSLTIEARGGAQ